MKFSSDGKQILSGGADGSPILWDVETGQIVRHLCCHSALINWVAFSPDGRYALSGAGDSTVRLWGLEAGYIIRPLAGHKGWIYGISVSPGGLTALSASWTGTASLLDLQTGQELHRLTVSDTLNSSAYSPDGHTAVIAVGKGSGLLQDIPGSIILWNLDTGQIIRRFDTPQPVAGVAFRP